MPNKKYSLEWIEKSYHDLKGSRILFEASHYSDTIAYLLHQSLEKMLKALYAYENKKIKKSHNLLELYELSPVKIELTEDEVYLLSIATTYYINQRYPVSHTLFPDKDEIKDILDFTESLFDRIIVKLDLYHIKDSNYE